MNGRPDFRWLVAAGLAAVPAAQPAFAVQYLTADQARRQAFPEASEFRIAAASRERLARAIAPEFAAPPGWAPHVVEALAGGKRLGWVVVDQVIGKTDAITFSVAIDAGGAVRSLEILEYRESHGGEVRNAAWRRQFVGKHAADRVALGADIRNISGATLSCRHVTEGVRRALLLVERLFRGA